MSIKLVPPLSWSVNGGVARRPKNWIDTEPEEQVQSNVASVETVVKNVATEMQQEDVVRVPNPNYGTSTSTQPQYMEFIPTPGFPKK
ncbi:hypothetical protein MTR_8g006515 [Medicago truncatula]|uniref:Uncharacterized protein n=1 Tax=Medicago truncatula TaxID=3880 RepID=A0A072TKS5_MEDTR|nr:hypothetical protein MTR_8g006515 [Medicago truncatula]